jgi:hypothetical protein
MASHAIDDIKRVFTAKPVDFNEFSLFPELPLEIRLIIWKHALPHRRNKDENHLISVAMVPGSIEDGEPVEIKFRIAPAQERLGFDFTTSWAYHRLQPTAEMSHMLLEEARADEKDQRDVRLLETCRESRLAFLEEFPESLPVHNTDFGVMRFNQHSTIFVSNLFSKELDDILFGAWMGHCKMPIFDKVRSVATSPKSGDEIMRPLGLAMFTGLEDLECGLSKVTRVVKDCNCKERGIDTLPDSEQAAARHFDDMARKFQSELSENHVFTWIFWLMDFKYPKLDVYHLAH